MTKTQIHYHGCWHEHHECAIARIAKLEEAIRAFCERREETKGKSAFMVHGDKLAYATFKLLLADDEKDREFWTVTRQNILAAREAVRQALGQH